MSQYHSCSATWVVAFLMVVPLGGSWLAAQDGVAPPTPAQEQPEILSRGPVHEAFAEPVTMDLQAGLMVPVPPPPNIAEIPPEERPQGQQFVWIPGYWSWDSDRNGYIWVSACWRVAPPKMSWVPGYWAQVPGGWQWVPGFWTRSGVREIEYLPPPPDVDDLEPYGSAPAPDMIWVPPCMYWSHGQYVRRDGYWLAAQPNWIWVPSHYVVSPRGCIFAEGHWDYSLEGRGVLFAPVYFPASVYGRVDFSFSPGIVIDVGLLQVSLFSYPRYSHYYFGDYYDDAYLNIGIYPWFDSKRLHTWYDPIYEHHRWRKNRSEPRWEDREKEEYKRRRMEKDLRPARTYREQESRLSKMPEPQRKAHQLAQPMSMAVTRQENPLKLERISPDARQKISREATAVRTFRDERNDWESKGRGGRTEEPFSDRKAPVMRPIERQQPVMTPREGKASVPQPMERREVIPQQVERKVFVPPPVERREAVPPAAAKREPVFVPPREVNVPRPERVRIPVPPVVGGPGAQGDGRRGPPDQPAGEPNSNQGGEAAADRDVRRDAGR